MTIEIVLIICFLTLVTSQDFSNDEREPLDRAIDKLKRSLKHIKLNRLDMSRLTNKACVEALGDICTDELKPVTCKNIGCLFPNSTIPACNNTEEVSDAISTHKAILKVLNPCTKTWPVPNDDTKYNPSLMEMPSEKSIEKLRKSLSKVKLDRLKNEELKSKSCVDAIADWCTDATEKFNCENTNCIHPRKSPQPCINKHGDPFAKSTHEAIVDILTNCENVDGPPTEIMIIPPGKLKPELEEPLKKLWTSLKTGDLKKLDINKLTNKECIEAIGDVCYDSKQPFSCEYTECLMIENPPDACRNIGDFPDAESTHSAIKNIITSCPKDINE